MRLQRYGHDLVMEQHQQEPASPGEHYSVLCGELSGKEIQETVDTGIADSLCYTAETNTTL